MATREIDLHQEKAKLEALLSEGRSQIRRRVPRSKRGVMNVALLADVHNAIINWGIYGYPAVIINGGIYGYPADLLLVVICLWRSSLMFFFDFYLTFVESLVDRSRHYFH